MKRRFGSRFARGGVARPTRTWSSISSDVALAAVTVTTAIPLIRLESPTSLNNITADPPEDLTVLRVMGALNVTVAGDTTANWTLALLVQDVTWTPSTAFLTDADKRILWSQGLDASNATSDTYSEPGIWRDGATGTAFPCLPYPFDIDIAPKVKIEPGKALYLVAYENVSGGTLTVNASRMRVLYQRTVRRR